MARDDKKYRDHEGTCIHGPDDGQLQKVVVLQGLYALRGLVAGIDAMQGGLREGKLVAS